MTKFSERNRDHVRKGTCKICWAFVNFRSGIKMAARKVRLNIDKKEVVYSSVWYQGTCCNGCLTLVTFCQTKLSEWWLCIVGNMNLNIFFTPFFEKNNELNFCHFTMEQLLLQGVLSSLTENNTQIQVVYHH